MPTQSEKALAFRALHARPGAFVIPNPWDAGSTLLLNAFGFEALATTSAGHAFALGRRDGGGGIGRAETLANARAIVEATHLPVSADAVRADRAGGEFPAWAPGPRGHDPAPAGVRKGRRRGALCAGPHQARADPHALLQRFEAGQCRHGAGRRQLLGATIGRSGREADQPRLFP